MERGIYFDGWHKDNHCYHPSLPFRSHQMIEDLERYQATILVWSAMGGGSISLPWLEHEAFGEVDPRLRFYGYMNDSEFIAECNKRGIKVMAILFEVQAWEFPIRRDAEGRLTAFNVIPDDGEGHDWYGLREFSNGQHADLFPTSLKDYYPNGIINSDGDIVTDLWEEVAARDYHGTPIHAAWVEVTEGNHTQQVYQTCRNNPVWREYMKKIMEVQIRAGVAGIQLDESELPLTSLRHGGCFCKDCRKQFRDYLQSAQETGTLTDEFADMDLTTFDYGDYLKSRGISFPEDPNGVPLFREYWEFQLRNVKKYFTELVDYAKDYARRTQGRELLMSGNFFNGMPVYYPIVHTVDVVTTEMERTLFRQPFWYRYINGFAQGKPTVIAENPYGGIIPELLVMLNEGKGYDLYRLLLLEGTAYGSNMSVPYGGWMGNTIKDAFWPPRHVTEEVQTFLADHQAMISNDSGAEIGIVYSWPSYYWRESTKRGGSAITEEENNIVFFEAIDPTDPNATRIPFWEEIRSMSEGQYIYDVVVMGDENLVQDRVTDELLDQYKLIILPDCNMLTLNQTRLLTNFVNKGGELLIVGRAADNHPDWLPHIQTLPGVHLCENPELQVDATAVFRQSLDAVTAGKRQVEVSDPSIGLNLHRTKNGLALHLLNYAYDEELDQVKSSELELSLNVGAIKSIRALGLDVNEEISFQSLGDNMIRLPEMPLYCVLDITTKG